MKITGLLNLVPKAFKANDNEIISDGGNKANEIIVNLSKNNKSKKLRYVLNIRATRKFIFLTPNTKKIFNYLRQAFIKALILQYFNLKNHIWIKPNISSYAIVKVLS